MNGRFLTVDLFDHPLPARLVVSDILGRIAGGGRIDHPHTIFDLSRMKPAKFFLSIQTTSDRFVREILLQ
jgi:hypothetical protein